MRPSSPALTLARLAFAPGGVTVGTDQRARRPRRASSAWVALALLLAGGCGERAEGLDSAKRRLEEGGHHLARFTIALDASTLGAKRCEAGRIDGLYALICEFRDATAAHRATVQQSAWIGDDITGVSVDLGPVTLALADRDRADANGRTASRVVHTFRGR